MNRTQWNNLSPDERNKAIEKFRGDKNSKYLISRNRTSFTEVFPDYEGDMNLAMELIENLAIGGDLIFRLTLKKFTYWRWGVEIIIDDDLYNNDKPEIDVSSAYMKTPQQAITTAYAKAVGIITED